MANLQKKNFFAQFLDSESKTLKKLTATEFVEVWNHFDKDGNGYIEGKELESFLNQFLSTASDGTIQELTPEEMKIKMADFLKRFDSNEDNRIELVELADILPEEENFLLLFRRANAINDSVTFMKLWKQFDKDNNGFIESNELKNFVKNLMQDVSANLSDDKLNEYTKTIITLFDQNKDGKLQLSEMARLLPAKNNHLAHPFLKNSEKITAAEIDKIFNHYDADNNGTIENEELDGFLKDLLASLNENYSMADLTNYKNIVLGEWDVDHDGKISRDELKMILLQHQHVSALHK